MTGPALPAAFLKGHIAHRGLHSEGVPENSMAAYRAAVELGVAIELDIQPSSDGVAMAFHDYDLHRLTAAAGPVDAQKAEALANIPLAGSDEGIPRFADVLAMVAGRVPLLIEIKDRDGDMGPDVGPLEDAVIADLAGYEGDAAVMSFNPYSVACFRDRAPHLPRGLVTSAFDARNWPELSHATRDRLRDIPDYEPLGCSFISHQANALQMPRVADLKSEGARILCWTIRSKAEEGQARKIADAVTFEGYLP
ncbi:Glycerophosphoryl diester phosphodiesterase [Jannaschia faecimaris]|uniref:Glycerophosphoryl diester phosphodiesterase n=1 Tax=Jannaschia faecimaris TaxID=1244108 RepID=A0A1H3IL72_9RHOB|nr:glycerophosphodiester phosphodiesterase family protein [Jannaschia faecimaris]SDY28039.1 Glycerophosphoryl diester phosphodiesterase [Jannaschia faecimaris]